MTAAYLRQLWERVRHSQIILTRVLLFSYQWHKRQDGARRQAETDPHDGLKPVLARREASHRVSWQRTRQPDPDSLYHGAGEDDVDGWDVEVRSQESRGRGSDGGGEEQGQQDYAGFLG